MKLPVTLSLAVAIILGTLPAYSQAPSRIEVAKVTGNIYELTVTYPYASNFVASVGEDGILLVDAGSKYTLAELDSVVKTLGNGRVKIIVNTHAHTEHTGGNKAFGKDVTKIAHDNVRTRLQEGTYLLEEFAEDALPVITFTDSMSLYFNGEKIRLIAIPGAHDDGDIIVHFTKSGVVSTGALCTGMHFPTIDGIGGNALKYPGAVQRLISLVPDDVVLIPGHGRSCSMAEEKGFQNMLATTIEIVKSGLATGRDAAALQRDSVLEDWISYEGGFSSASEWIQSIANAVQNVRPKKPSAVELYYAQKGMGIDSAIAKWYELKRTSPKDYSFGEGQIVLFGYYLLGKGRYQDAIRMFEVYVNDFPDSWNSYDCLAEAHMNAGNKELARKYYEKSLELNPSNTNAVEMMKKL
jgi:glyoxylase-like metal-dependent hydrolase (beta-lactamase superfamily II)